MLSDHHRIKWRRNIGENFNRLSRVHERYRRQTDDRRQTTDDRQTDGRRHIANMNMSSRSLKSGWLGVDLLIVSPCHKVHQLSTTDALCSSQFEIWEFSPTIHYGCSQDHSMSQISVTYWIRPNLAHILHCFGDNHNDYIFAVDRGTSLWSIRLGWNPKFRIAKLNWPQESRKSLWLTVQSMFREPHPNG